MYLYLRMFQLYGWELGLIKFSQAASEINFWIDPSKYPRKYPKYHIRQWINISLFQQNEDICIGFVDSWYNRRLGPRIHIFRQKQWWLYQLFFILQLFFLLWTDIVSFKIFVYYSKIIFCFENCFDLLTSKKKLICNDLIKVANVLEIQNNLLTEKFLKKSSISKLMSILIRIDYF